VIFVTRKYLRFGHKQSLPAKDPKAVCKLVCWNLRAGAAMPNEMSAACDRKMAGLVSFSICFPIKGFSKTAKCRQFKRFQIFISSFPIFGRGLDSHRCCADLIAQM
jgi:hypothetical protein